MSILQPRNNTVRLKNRLKHIKVLVVILAVLLSVLSFALFTIFSANHSANLLPEDLVYHEPARKVSMYETPHGSQPFLKDVLDNHKTTAIIIATHLVPSHPSLDMLMEVLNSTRTYFKGLPHNAPVIITVDGIQKLIANDKRKGDAALYLSKTNQNREKFKLYLNALQEKFGNDPRFQVLVSDDNVGLSTNLLRAMTSLDPDTKYVYILQHDLPFRKEIDHTNLLKTALEDSNIRLVSFSRVGSNDECIGHNSQVEKNGIRLKKFSKWSDQNQFASVQHYMQDIFPWVKTPFPEMVFFSATKRNCTYYGPYFYENGKDMFYGHTDATERYGKKLARRIVSGEVDITRLSSGNLIEMRREFGEDKLNEMLAKAKEGQTREK